MHQKEKSKQLAKEKEEQVEKKNKGITLIALVVLLILAGVAINMSVGQNGIFTRAKEATIVSALASVKEEIKLESGARLIDNESLTPEIMLAEGKAKRTVQQGEDGNYYMYYALKEGAYKGMQNLGKGNIAELKDVFLIDDNLNIKYIASNGKEYGDQLENKTLNDETEIKFTSKEFEKYIEKISGVTDGIVRFKWMKNLTSLTIEDESIDSLEDLVFFPELTSLTLGGWNNNNPNNTSMNGIENCKKLTNLKIYYGVDNKDYTALKSLKNLSNFSRVGGTDYKAIIDNIKYCDNLKNFTLQFVQGSIDLKELSQLNNLTSLSVIGATSDVTGVNIKSLNNLTNLQSLTLSNLKISKIEGLEKLVNLVSLNLSNNEISDITPLKYNINLTNLNLKGNSNIKGNRDDYTDEEKEALNEIGKILDRDGTINIDIDKLGLFTNYKTLDLSEQKLETLDYLNGITDLESLNLDNNKLTLNDSNSIRILEQMQNLKTLYLSRNVNIEDISFVNNMPNLTQLIISGCTKIKLKQIQNRISSLSIAMSAETLKSLEECDEGTITKLNIREDYGPNLEIDEFPVYKCFSNLKELYLANKSGIQDFSNIAQITTLEKLNLSNCELNSKEKIDFSKLTNLKELTLSGNYINTDYLKDFVEKIKDNTSLAYLDLRSNSINDPTSLLKLRSNIKVYLSGNVNISQEAKNQLTEHFGNNVYF